jgi:Coenzyme PQQ synthesis protein D (PqqD)
MLRKPNKEVRDVSPDTTEPLVIRSRSVVSRVVAGETLIVPVRGKVGDLACIYSFNRTGSLIWKVLESPRTLAELTAAVGLEFAVELEQAERDVRQFVDELYAVGLVETLSAPPMGIEKAVGRQAGAR